MRQLAAAFKCLTIFTLIKAQASLRTSRALPSSIQFLRELTGFRRFATETRLVACNNGIDSGSQKLFERRKRVAAPGEISKAASLNRWKESGEKTLGRRTGPILNSCLFTIIGNTAGRLFAGRAKETIDMKGLSSLRGLKASFGTDTRPGRLCRKRILPLNGSF